MAAANELIAIELQLKGYEGVMSDMRMLDKMLHGFRGGKNRLIIQSNLAKAKKDVIAYEAEVKRLKKELASTSKGFMKGNTWVRNPAWSKLNRQLTEAKQKLLDAKQAAQEFQYALSNFKQVSFRQAFNFISSSMAHIGSAMQSMGNAMTRLTSPFRRFTTGLLYGAGYRALNMLTEGFSGAFERYDTMQNYTKTLTALGLEAEKTFKVFSKQDKPLNAIENLNEAVLGLPTGLDEIAAAQKVYAGATGEMVKSTKLAIAANNTFLASSMGAREQRFMQRYLASLASGADLTTTQWQSIGRIAPLALNAIADKLKVTTDDLRNGRVEGEKFLEAFIEVGTEGKIQAAANVMKTTYEGLVANIQNATKRMGEGILKTLDDVFIQYNGRNLIQNLLGFDAEGNDIGGGIKHFINDISAGVQEWVKANPEKITEFIDAIKGVDWKSLLRGIGEGFLQLANAAQKFAEFLGGRDLSGIGRFMVTGNMYGKALTIFGGLLKGTRHVIGLIGAATFVGFIRRGGIFGAIKSLLIGGKGATMATVATEAGEMATAAPKLGKVSVGLSRFFKGWAEIATIVGGTAFVGWASIKMFKNTLKDIGEIADIVNEIDWSSATPALLGFADFIAGFSAVGAALSHFGIGLELLEGVGFAGAITTFITGIADLDMALIKGTVKKLADTIGYLQEAIDGLNKLGKVTDVQKALDNAGKAVEVFNQIREVFKGKVDHFSGETTSGLQGFTKGSRKTIKNVAEAVTDLKTAIETLNEFAKLKIDIKGVEDLAPKLTDALSALRTTILAIPSEWKDEGIVDSTGNLSSSLTNLKSSFDAIVGKDGILAQIPQMLSSINNLMRSGSFDSLPDKMAVIGNALKGAYDALNSGIGNGNYMATNLDNFRQALKSAKFAILHLQEIGGMTVDDSAVKNIKDIFAKIKEAFNDDEVNGIAETINTFKTAIGDALKSFEEFNEPIEITPTIKLGSEFGRSVNDATGKIKDGKSKIESAINSIQSNYYKYVTVHVIMNTAVSGAKTLNDVTQDAVNNVLSQTGGGNGRKPSSGGFITRQGTLYRSGGGGVFKPRGTDKIPAMLTAGEYVHKKQAVDFFGTDFMQKVNAMDVRGAMQALLTKAGNSTNIGRQSIVNNTVNNNQRVTQNINTNNPNFTRVQMGRFAGAL